MIAHHNWHWGAGDEKEIDDAEAEKHRRYFTEIAKTARKLPRHKVEAIWREHHPEKGGRFGWGENPPEHWGYALPPTEKDIKQQRRKRYEEALRKRLRKAQEDGACFKSRKGHPWRGEKPTPPA